MRASNWEKRNNLKLFLSYVLRGFLIFVKHHFFTGGDKPHIYTYRCWNQIFSLNKIKEICQLLNSTILIVHIKQGMFQNMTRIY